MIGAMKPEVGETAPEFRAMAVFPNGEEEVSLYEMRGQRVVLVFYPKNGTPGCTIQACSLRDHWEDVEGKARVFGVSADSMESHRKFLRKKDLPYPLIVDAEHVICEAYGVWSERSMMGRKFMGIERSTFVIGGDGRIESILEKVSPMSHTSQLVEILRK